MTSQNKPLFGSNAEKLRKSRSNFLHLQSYRGPRPRTPELTGDYERDHLEFTVWKDEIKNSAQPILNAVKKRRNRDIAALKDTYMYIKYAKANHYGEVPRVPTPEAGDVT